MAARIALVVFPGFQILDFAALTVFELANLVHGTQRYQVETISHGGGIVASSAGVPVATQPFGRRAYDTLLIAGPTVVTPPEPELLAALRRASPRARRTGCLCTGAFVAAAAGLLAGRRVTTHWALGNELKKLYPDIELDDDKIYVNDGPMWTSAGMSACIDLALGLVEADLGVELAKAVARKMVMYHRRTGGQSQFSMLSEMDGGSDRIRSALLYAKENLHRPLSVEQLAEHVHWSPRHFSRAFREQTGHSPAKAIEKLRLEAARALIEDGHASIGRIATQTGFGDEERMRRAFVRTLGRPPQALMREARMRIGYDVPGAA
ncbi:transcriptional regulator GlxA family with amidase domain [Pseudoduganella flava]|uniref:Helix-turn-helix domain-containing protein n=1 Tax=Pseudoduganella flava TaxID=871742 RepID=A0A562PZ42_9BURK|nr:helix-turn-helix domain-containing protein [Pseudoduganella flava]QGZ38746.1 helix-turn-helix domain-containing protein [Pseudoduganella flava]TWI49677.1 transcriptional regulator GlxA family with amidase domain [Pseudoduganella flava]